MSVPRQAIPQVLAGPQQFVLADSLSGHGIPKEARFCGEFRQRMLPGLSSCRPFPDCTEDVPVLCCGVHPGHSWNGVSCGQPFRTVDAPGIRYRLGWKGRTNNTMPRLPALHVCGSSSLSGVFDLQSTSVPTRVSIREANPRIQRRLGTSRSALTNSNFPARNESICFQPAFEGIDGDRLTVQPHCPI